MKRGFLRLTLLSIVFALSLTPVAADAAAAEKGERTQEKNQCLTPSSVQLRDQLRYLWTDHAIWTRNYIVSAVAGLDDQSKALDRILRNQQEIGNAIKPYYGEAAGNQLAKLLKEHILIAGKIVDAAKKGKNSDVEKYNQAWYQNADDLARFLSSANPNWPEKQLKDILYTHLKQVADILKARLAKNWEADIAAFDQGKDHLIMLADVLADGIIKQFPGQFN